MNTKVGTSLDTKESTGLGRARCDATANGWF